MLLQNGEMEVSMHPLIHIGPVELPTYGTIILIGFIIGVMFMMHHGKIYGYTKADFLIASMLSAIGLIVGAKVIFFISVLPEIISHWDIAKENIPYTIYYSLSGFVFYGGLIGVLLMLLLFCKQMEYSFLEFTNIVAPVIPFIHGLGRIGCFFGGCCYGIEYNGPFYVKFPPNEFVTELSGVNRFPVQLLECLINMIIFVCLYYYSRKKRKPGSMLGMYLITYSIVRFSLEFLRGDVSRGIFLGVSTSQWISLLLLPIGLYLLFRKKKEQ